MDMDFKRSNIFFFYDVDVPCWIHLAIGIFYALANVSCFEDKEEEQ